MEGYQHLYESMWRRGWRDTRAAWTSWYFFILDAVVAVVIGSLVVWWAGLIGVVFGMVCVWISFTVRAFIQQRNEARKIVSELTTPKLIVRCAEIYEVGDGRHWLRLKVENPTALPIKNCYGKLFGRRMVAGGLTLINGISVRRETSPEAGRLSSEHMQLPPEGHRFPWSPADQSLISINISGNGGSEFLYLVSKRDDVGCFWFASNVGNDYENWALADFELQLEVGSETEAYVLTRVRVIFRAEGGDLEFLNLDMIN